MNRSKVTMIQKSVTKQYTQTESPRGSILWAKLQAYIFRSSALTRLNLSTIAISDLVEEVIGVRFYVQMFKA